MYRSIDFLEIETAIQHLQAGRIIAYPTESVYGLGCDPNNPSVVMQLTQLKNRSFDKGYILVASDWQQVEHLVEPVEPKLLAQVFTTWPGPVTWVFPAKSNVSRLIRGKNSTIAIRISAHPIIHALCEQFDQPIISTSANLEGEPPAKDPETIRTIFKDQIAQIVSGNLGHLTKPTIIRDVISGEIIRHGGEQ